MLLLFHRHQLAAASILLLILFYFQQPLVAEDTKERTAFETIAPKNIALFIAHSNKARIAAMFLRLLYMMVH